jgi:hypothetical protein
MIYDTIRDDIILYDTIYDMKKFEMLLDKMRLNDMISGEVR